LEDVKILLFMKNEEFERGNDKNYELESKINELKEVVD
jgi:hypothetical protein